MLNLQIEDSFLPAKQNCYSCLLADLLHTLELTRSGLSSKLTNVTGVDCTHRMGISEVELHLTSKNIRLNALSGLRNTPIEMKVCPL